MQQSLLQEDFGGESTQIRWFSGSQEGKAGLREQQPEDIQEKLKTQEDKQAQIGSDQKVLMVVRQGGWTA